MSTFKATFHTNSNFNAKMKTSVAPGYNVLVATTEQWNSERDLVGKENIVYVYSDAHTNSEGAPIPAYKVGDGASYLIDLPFDDDIGQAHISNTDIHITDEERIFWNNKVTAFINVEDIENLVLSKNAEPNT